MNQAIKERIEKIKRGEMPEGYKRTRAGISPFDWDVKPSKNLFSNYNDKNHNGDLTVLSASQEHGIIPRDKIDIDIKYNSENLKTYKKVQPGDFVISLRSFQGGIEYSEHLGLVSPAYTVLKSKPGVFNRFYRYYFKTIDFISRLNSTIYGIRDGKQIGYEDFSTLLLHNPPFREQEKIAEILSTWDKAILLMENLIEQKKKQKKWLIQNLLDPDSGVRLSGFEGEWKEKNIGDLFEFLSSVPASRDQLGNKGFCYLHYGDIHKSKKPYINVEDEYKNIPKLNIDKVPDNAILQNGDVVFVDASEDYEGASKYIVVENKFNRPFIAGLHTIGIRSKNDELNNEFKKYCFQSYSIKKQISFYASGIKVYGLSRDNLAKLIVKFPNIDEQKAIANILSTADKEIYLLEQKLEQLQKQKKALMQLLLTGIVRVTA